MTPRRAVLILGGIAAATTGALSFAARATTPAIHPEKLRMEAVEAADRASARAHAAPPKLPNAPAPPAAAEPAWRDGIIDSGLAPLPASRFVIANQWHRVLGREHVNVYAGALRSDRRRGVVVVETTRLDLAGAGSPGGVYVAPGAAGALRIVGERGPRLVLEATNGDRWLFDLRTRSFAEA